jgi:glycosyltransferase involved in cell wall biosynthesis
MNVVFATYDDSPPEGGQGVYVRDLRAALQSRGVRVTTISGRGDHAIPYPRIVRRAPLDFSIALTRNPACLLASRPDAVHVQGGPGGVMLPRRMPVPLVYTAHHTYRQAYSHLAPGRALATLERRSYVYAATVLAVSTSTADAVRAMGITSVEVVPPGVDVDRFTADGTRRDPHLVLFAGRLEVEKGPLDAVAAMRQLAADRPGVHGVVVGSGRLATRVRDAAAATGGVVEVRGAVSDDELRRLYASATLLLVPSTYEGLGLVALEAMAAGAAVVAYDVTGLRDAVGDAGVLVEPGDAASLAAAARTLLDDGARRAELVARARERVIARHSWATCAARVEDAYRAAIAQA